VQFRHQHRLITQKRNELEKELEHARKQHAALFNQVEEEVVVGVYNYIRQIPLTPNTLCLRW
jgi:hypothetical protein